MSFLLGVLELSFTRFLNKHITFVILILLWAFELLKRVASYVQIHMYTCFIVSTVHTFLCDYFLRCILFARIHLLFYVWDNHEFMQRQFLVKRTYRGLKRCERIYMDFFVLFDFSPVHFAFRWPRCLRYELVSSFFLTFHCVALTQRSTHYTENYRARVFCREKCAFDHVMGGQYTNVS